MTHNTMINDNQSITPLEEIYLVRSAQLSLAKLELKIPLISAAESIKPLLSSQLSIGAIYYNCKGLGCAAVFQVRWIQIKYEIHLDKPSFYNLNDKL